MIRVTGDRVLVALPPAPADLISDGGIVLVRDPEAVKVPTRGIVVGLGEKTGMVAIDDVVGLINEAPFMNGPFVDPLTLRAQVQAMAPASFDVALGECVLFPLSAGDEIHVDGVAYVILREAEILGVLDPITPPVEVAYA